jgi:hypothetical protein
MKRLLLLSLVLVARLASGQISGAPGSWSAGVTLLPCSQIYNGQLSVTLSGRVWYYYMTDTTPSVPAVGTAAVSWGPNSTYGGTGGTFMGLWNLYGGTLGYSIYAVRLSEIDVNGVYLGKPFHFQVPGQLKDLRTGSGTTAVRGWAPPGLMGCNTNNQVYLNWSYTNNTASPLVITGLPGQTEPMYLAPGASANIPITSQGDSGFQLNIAPMGQGGYLNSDFAYVTNWLGTNGFQSVNQGGNPDINNMTNAFNNGQVAAVLSATGMVNGPIVWNNTDDGLARDSTARAGYSAIVNAINQNGSQLLKSLVAKGSNGSAPTVNVTVTNTASGGGASNVFVMNWPTNLGGSYSITNQVSGGTNNITVTNLGGAWTNGITSNQLAGLVGSTRQQAGDNLTNSALGQIKGATNQAAGLSAGSVVTAAGSSFAGTLAGDGTGGGGSRDVTLSPGVVMTISTANLPSAFFTLKTVFSWAIYVSVFVTCWKIFSVNIKEALRVPQATTAGETILGTNVNIASTLIMAGIIIAAIATLTAVALPKLLTYLALIVGNPFSGLDGFGYAFVDSMVPIPLLLSSIGVVTTFRLVMDSGGMVVGGIIKLLVGA